MNRLLPVLLLLLAPASLAAQGTAGRRSTYVVVHGAWGGSWDWKHVDSLLTRQRHKVYRASLTGLGERVHLASPNVGLDTHIDDVVNLITWENLHDVVLIGHSYGGMVITGVASRIPERLARLIYVDAMLPDSGETAVGLLSWLVASGSKDGMVPASWEPAAKPIPKDVAQPLKTFTDTIHLNAARLARVRALYILTVEPGREPDPFQLFAERAAARKWKIVRMQADHVPERSAPAALVELLR